MAPVFLIGLVAFDSALSRLDGFTLSLNGVHKFSNDLQHVGPWLTTSTQSTENIGLPLWSDAPVAGQRREQLLVAKILRPGFHGLDVPVAKVHPQGDESVPERVGVEIGAEAQDRLDSLVSKALALPARTLDGVRSRLARSKHVRDPGSLIAAVTRDLGALWPHEATAAA